MIEMFFIPFFRNGIGQFQIAAWTWQARVLHQEGNPVIQGLQSLPIGFDFRHGLWSCNSNSNIDWITKRISTTIRCLPRAFIDPICKRSGENDLKRGLRTGTGRVEHHLFRCAENSSAEMFETIIRVPIAGAIIFDEPLFVYARAIGDERVVGDGDILDKMEIVRTILWIYCGNNGGQRRRLNNDNLFGWLNNES